MKRVAIVSFPGNNCEVESIRAIKQAGMEPVWFRWNDDTAKLGDIEAYFIPGGFSYEDRGRAGMVAARNPLLEFVGKEAASGKVVIGNCNGAQVLVESGLIPVHERLRMSLARNIVEGANGTEAPGFLNEWVWIKPQCPQNRCATSNWSEPMHVPIAHGEGRFITMDLDLLEQLKQNNQLAFVYCDKDGDTSEAATITPNGSMFGAAGICNPEGNVVALMPHPERTPNGQPYFESLRLWLENPPANQTYEMVETPVDWQIELRPSKPVELFIDTIIVNNEERTVEQTAKRYAKNLRLTQLKYFAPADGNVDPILQRISLFNPNKETAYIREQGQLKRWNHDTKTLEDVEGHPLQSAEMALLRRDIPDVEGQRLGAETGICYVCEGITKEDLSQNTLLEVFANSHASTLEQMS